MAAAAILGVVASLVGPAIEVGKCFQKQLNYLCCFQTNVKALDDAAKNLADAEADLQARVDEAKRNGEPISSQVETWLAKAGETQVNNTLGIGTTQKPRIFNLKSRYFLSRKAIKTAQSMNQHRDACNFDRVTNPALPASMHHEGRPQAPPAPGGWIESRKKTEDDIIIAMRERSAYIIGMCGMGGVGKTTMAKQIMNRAKEDEGLFGEVLLVVVGQRADMLQIQNGILDWLGLKLNEETLAPKAIRLRDRLLGGNRKLIVIDDVWEIINLEELGIPFQSDSCTILLASRDSRVLHQMNARRVFTVENLSEEEAWSIFQENVGACLDDDPNLLPTARDVAKECKGLPLALVAVSRALKDQASKGIWSDALKQLQSSNPLDIPGFIEEVYNPIRLSFDFLKSPHAKSLLFLCSSFPDDHQISLEHLALYGFGLCILGDDIDNLEDARNRITGLVDMLKSRFLILDGEDVDEHRVKMHDVVRDMANFIAKQENHAILDSTSLDRSKQNSHISDCNMLSVIQNQSQIDFPKGLIFPNLSFLWMYNPIFFEKYYAITQSVVDVHPMSDNFLEGMQQLKVLSITRFSFGFTPQNMRLLKNIRSLHLYDCNLQTLSAVGELSSLEILCCHSCETITELPVEIGGLKRLRLLEVTNCGSLKTIVAGVISRLGQLEELKILDGFNGWESEETKTGRSNASLAELQSLSKLTCLEIEIKDWSLDAQVLNLSSKIVKYNIRVGKRSPWWEPTSTSTTYEKKLSVSLQMSTSLRNWIDVFARTAEYICLDGVDSNGFDFSGNQNIRCLVFENFQTVVKLVSFSSTDFRFGVFPVLEHMHLGSLPMFEEICDGPIPNGSNSFAKLKEISLSNLDRLRRVFSSSVVIRSLSQLSGLEIENCESMEEVFLIEKDDGNSPSSRITFRKLKTLSLKRMENLTYLCKGVDIIEFPQLFQLDIKYCPKLTSLGKASNHQNHASSSGRHDSVHIFCNTKLDDTIHWRIPEYQLFMVSPFSIQTLIIDGCDDIAYVIAAADDIIATSSGKIIFPKLYMLVLRHLRSLKAAFSKGIHDINIEFHLLKVLSIIDCPKLTSVVNIQSDQNDHVNSSSTHHPSLHLICYTKSTFCNLEVLRIEGCVNINNLFSYSVAANLVNLKQLTIRSCDEMVYVVTEDDAAEASEKKTHIIMFHKLKELTLHDLLKLQNFCEGRWDIQLPSLKELNIKKVGFYSARECLPLFCNTQSTFDKLTKLHIQGFWGDRDHMKHLFSYSVAGNLVNLKTLYISDYKEMVYVIADIDDDIAKTSGNNPQTIKGCNDMLYAIADDDAKTYETKLQQIIFHKLEEFTLHDLPKLQNFCEGRWDIQLPSLKQLLIKNVGFHSARECVPLFCNTQITFDELKELHIQGYSGTHDHIKHLFSYSIVGNLVNLRRLEISSFSEIVYVIADDENIAKTFGNNPQTIFHKLEFFILNDLPKLQNFCERRWDIQLQPLKELVIKNVGFYSARECVPLFCNTQITFDKLTRLCLQGYLGDRDHIKHLFSYSVAGNLVNLKTLYISDYKEMVYVIANEDNIAKTYGNNPQTIFHQLEWVHLNHLPKLESLCDWGWDVQFPSLKTLWISYCPGMEGVTPESIKKTKHGSCSKQNENV